MTQEGSGMDIYVGNLPWSCNDDDLRELFQPFGQVEGARVITDRETGRSRGFGFVQMPNSEEAAQAIQNLDGKDMDGRLLRVNESQPKQRGNGYGTGGSGRRW
ncbi:MAG: RNA-binding protein [Candidatus Krumholzibacteria bacterium]|nr:RNA-binding protein [Candidatus Krumholzibacteria bacterium]